jgi:prevent-host-death family protein
MSILKDDGGIRMASSVALSEAQSRLGELMDRAESGEEIVIERAGRNGVKLVPISVDPATPSRRVGGQNLLGVTYIAPDFDAPMPEEELREWGY